MESSIIKRVKLCLTCKRAKFHSGRQHYGPLSPRTLKTANTWDVVQVDLIGPYDGYYGITIIEQATRWLEVGIHPDKNILTTAESFYREWICRYPCSVQVIHDLGAEFTGEESQELLQIYGIKPKPITAKNLQANAISSASTWSFSMSFVATTISTGRKHRTMPRMLFDPVITAF